MNLRNKLFPLFFLLVTQLVLQLYVCDAEAVQGQSYSGDGAINNVTVPPGGWVTNFASDGACFACHVPANSFDAPDMTSYLKTGHKNMLRMVTPGIPLTGPNGQAYSGDQSGNSFDWTSGNVNIAGYCTNPAYTDQSSCTTGGGTWIAGSKNLYYIFDGWMGGPATPGSVYDGSYILGGNQYTAVSYGCGRCHTTGFTLDTSVSPGARVVSYCTKPAYTTRNTCVAHGGTWITTSFCRAPEYYFSGITWTPTNTTGLINFDPDGDGTAVSSSWAINCSTGESMEGVECERCHDATNHFTTGVTRPTGTAATALCLQCHRQDHILHYTAGGLGANIVPTAYTDNGTLPANEPSYALPAIEVGGATGYAPQFFKYSTGMEFLNSVHARFGGNFQQIADFTRYNSGFQETLYTCSNPLHVTQSTCTSNGGTWSSSIVQGGCTTCHEVHQSTVKDVNASAPYKNTCPDCHADKASTLLSTIYHPSGTGTPLGDGSDIAGACQSCHMPTPQGINARAAHLWRINTDASYYTFPTLSQWTAGQKTAFTSPESFSTPSPGVYNGAVWLDVDLVCGQCHNGSTPGVPVFTRNGMAAAATGIHGGSQSGMDCTACHTTDSIAPSAVYHPTGAGTPGTGTAACVTCHLVGGTTVHQNSSTDPSTITSTICNQCHGGSPTLTIAHYFNSGNIGTFAAGMHVGPTPSTTCTNCHAEQISTMNHPHVAMLSACEQCHSVPGASRPGVLPLNVDTTCGTCHGGGTSSATNPPAQNIIWLSHDTLTARANNDFHNMTPDLAISNLLVTNDAGLTQKTTTTSAGKTVYITDITININYGPANASTTAFYMSTTSDLTGKVGSAFCSRSVPALPGATASGPVTTTCTVPAVALGTYYIVANADDGNTSGETNKTNNTRAFGPVSVVANNVDLVVSNSSYAPAGATRGTSINVTDVVINLGSGTAGASQTGIYLLTSCPAPSATPPAIASQIGTRSIASIAGGGSNSGTTSVTVPLTATVGTNYIVFYADWQNAVGETNKLNNARCRAIVIK